MTQNTITLNYEQSIDCFIATMPNGITLEMLHNWSAQFDREIAKLPTDKHFSVLIDTGTHEFESVACLKYLRDYLTDTPAFKQKVVKGAFVAPPQYVTPHMESLQERYFNDTRAALAWIQCAERGSTHSSWNITLKGMA